MTQALIVLIRGYQAFSRACAATRFEIFAFSGCPQWPTCSEFAIAAIREHGPLRGSAKAFARVLRCNPLTYRHVH